MTSNISCPVDYIQINENRVRITAFQILILGIIFLATKHWIIPAFLIVDFFLRGFRYAKYSPLNLISGWLVDKLSIKNKPIDQAPKIFAAQMGFVLSVILFFVSIFGLTVIAMATASIIILFSGLESVLGICAGCYVYTFLRKIKRA